MFRCKSKLQIRFTEERNFIKIVFIPGMDHSASKIISIYKGLEEFFFFQKQIENDCFNIYNTVKNSGKFFEYIDQPPIKPRRDIQKLWLEYFAKIWKKYADPLLSCRILLKKKIVHLV